jgi:hypothetical protein
MGKGLLTIDGISWAEVWNNSLIPGIERYNQYDQTDIEVLLAAPRDEKRSQYFIANGNAFAEMGQLQRPDPQKMVRGYFQGFTKKFGTSYGYTFDWLKDATSKDIEALQADILRQDRDNKRDVILKAGLYTSTDGFWNGSYETAPSEGITAPPPYGKNTFSANHSHYIGTSQTTILLTEVAEWRTHIREHGFQGPIVGFINSTDSKAIAKALLPTDSGIKVSNPLTDFVSINGYIGRAGGVDWTETEWVPSGYVLLYATAVGAGSDSAKPVRLIEPTNPSFRGLIIIPGENPQYPIINSYYLRYLGAKVLHRGAGVAVKLGNATYSNPTI